MIPDFRKVLLFLEAFAARPACRRASVFLKRHRGACLGALVGLPGGLFGAAAGIVLGAMVDALLERARADRAVAAYLESPGPADFQECAPGAAAASALLVLTLAAGKPRNAVDELSPDRAARAAAAALRLGPRELPELESYARAALRRRAQPNPDLLAESLRARADAGKCAAVAQALLSAAEGPRADELARRAASVLSPGSEKAPRRTRADPDDPYSILGLAPDAPAEEVKAVFRRLAVQFHPDSVAGFGAEKEKAASEAFIRLEAAYREILKRRGSEG